MVISVRRIAVALVFLCGVWRGVAQPAVPDYAKAGSCGPGKRRGTDGVCVDIDSADVMRGLQWVGNASRTTCNKETVIDGISVCEDNLPPDGQCTIWSITASLWCEAVPDMKFERYWSQRCDVNLYHFYSRGRSPACTKSVSGKRGEWPDYPKMQIKRMEAWGRRCPFCFWLHGDMEGTSNIDVLKVQELGASLDTDKDSGDGAQMIVLSDLFMLHPRLIDHVGQLLTQLTISSSSLMDSLGREAEMNFNMWAISAMLAPKFSLFRQRLEAGAQPPLQYRDYLTQAGMDPSISHYHHSYMQVRDDTSRASNAAHYAALTPKPRVGPPVRGDVPPYCKVPSPAHDAEMQAWINLRLLERCHPTRLWVSCHKRSYLPVLPCPKDLMDTMAEDYAHSKRWCDYQTSSAEPEPIKVPIEAVQAFQKPSISGGGRVRLAFFLTVYTDAPAVARLLSRLYSPEHYYLLHIDAAGTDPEFERAVRSMCAKFDNVFLAKDLIIVYGASTASILLTRVMAWFHHNAKGWDYFVPVTGADYPLVPLPRMEKILAYQDPPMPMVMAWSPMTSRSIFRLKSMHPIFEQDTNLKEGLDVLLVDRGRGVMGQVNMESRSFNFGPPLTCEGQKAFIHIDSRRNLSAKTGDYDTQWLFPRDPWPRKGYATTEEVWTPKAVGASAPDGKFRSWRKSDPGTTGVYDAKSIEYIVTSDEGKRYYHFFKYMLLGSEEHYYVSLLNNWDRTKFAVLHVKGQSVYNTWKLGMQNDVATGFLTHTNYLSDDMWEYIRGMSRRGVFFGRKFSSKKNKDLIDRIDKELLLSNSSEAGVYWPGFFPVDNLSPPGKFKLQHAAMKLSSSGVAHIGSDFALRGKRYFEGGHIAKQQV